MHFNYLFARYNGTLNHAVRIILATTIMMASALVRVGATDATGRVIIL